jgi:hypothetical protein
MARLLQTKSVMTDGRHSPIQRRYANWLEVSFSTDEFVLDFGQKLDEAGGLLHSGIVTTPGCIDSFIDILTRSREGHQRRFGARRNPNDEDEP